SRRFAWSNVAETIVLRRISGCSGRPLRHYHWRIPSQLEAEMTQFDHDDLHQRIAERARSVTWDADVPTLVTEALNRGEGELTADGALAVTTGIFTGRSVKDKFIVADELTTDRVWWDNSFGMAPSHFSALLEDMLLALDECALQR